MISAVIPTLNAEATLERTLAGLAQSSLIGEIIVADAAGTDATKAIAERHSAAVIACERGRGRQLAAGAARARHDWLLFLHADTVLGEGWAEAADRFMADNDDERAAVFRFALDDTSSCARVLEWFVKLRVRVFALPYGDQGLLISRAFYDSLGGFKPLPLMEDVDLIRRIGRKRLRSLAAPAITSAARYKSGGYMFRPLRNLFCLTLYFLGVAPEKIERFYR
ncbi:MAG: TIGR04283 family arsenosugar biosynthesis glycosyltransferase [Rhodospirillales bacterium]